MLLCVRRPRTTVRHSLFYFGHIGHCTSFGDNNRSPGTPLPTTDVYRGSFGDVKLFKMRDLIALTTWYHLISVHGSLLLDFNCILKLLA